jgi:hypothetical protein
MTVTFTTVFVPIIKKPKTEVPELLKVTSKMLSSFEAEVTGKEARYMCGE